jgi:hypothetical protein
VSTRLIAARATRFIEGTMSDADPIRELLGPAADLPAPASPDDRTEEGEESDGPGADLRRRSEDRQTQPDADAGG